MHQNAMLSCKTTCKTCFHNLPQDQISSAAVASERLPSFLYSWILQRPLHCRSVPLSSHCLTPTCLYDFQVIGPNQGDAYLKMKLKDQNKAMQILQESPSLQGLVQIQAPYVDLEVRGLPALQYFGNLVWQDAFKEQTGLL